MAAPLGTSDRRRGRCRDRRAAHRAAHRRAAHRRAAHRRAAHRRAAHCRDRCGAQAMGCGGGDLARPRRRENARGADPCRDQSRRDEGASAAEEATTTCADSAAAAPAVGLAAADGLPARRPPRIFSRGAALRPSRTKNCQTTTSSLAWRAAARGQTPLPSRDLRRPPHPPDFCTTISCALGVRIRTPNGPMIVAACTGGAAAISRMRRSRQTDRQF